jgi:hypothetical protein
MKLRAGLLLERSPEVYTFPHRTFQEYLAGAHLASQPDFARQAATLATEGALWREVILLAVGRLVYRDGDTAASEAEWEKAARGTDGREYPWGNDWQEEYANTDEAQIGHPSAVGCFPHDVSPYGCQDVAGNVWEWTRSLWGKDWEKPDFTYPYRPNDGREDMNAEDEILRVLRGGGFRNSRRSARCASRLWNNPNGRHDRIGCRLVVRPPL